MLIALFPCPIACLLQRSGCLVRVCVSVFASVYVMLLLFNTMLSCIFHASEMVDCPAIVKFILYFCCCGCCYCSLQSVYNGAPGVYALNRVRANFCCRHRKSSRQWRWVWRSWNRRWLQHTCVYVCMFGVEVCVSGVVRDWRSLSIWVSIWRIKRRVFSLWFLWHIGMFEVFFIFLRFYFFFLILYFFLFVCLFK